MDPPAHPSAPQEWQQTADGVFVSERRLPNGVVFGTRAKPFRDRVEVEMWLTNGSNETLRKLVVQNCVMLKGAPSLPPRRTPTKSLRLPTRPAVRIAGTAG